MNSFQTALLWAVVTFFFFQHPFLFYFKKKINTFGAGAAFKLKNVRVVWEIGNWILGGPGVERQVWGWGSLLHFVCVLSTLFYFVGWNFQLYFLRDLIQPLRRHFYRIILFQNEVYNNFSLIITYDPVLLSNSLLEKADILLRVYLVDTKVI